MKLAGASAAALRILSVIGIVLMLRGFADSGRIAARSVAVVAALDQSRSISPDQ